MPPARGHVQVEHGVLLRHMAVRRVLSDDYVTPMHETVGRLGPHYGRAVRRTDAGHGRGIRAPAVGAAEDVHSAGTKPIPPDRVHMRHRRARVLLVYSKSGEYSTFERSKSINSSGHQWFSANDKYSQIKK